MAKLISFKDMYTVEYRPGEDELTNYRAYRRKRLYEKKELDEFGSFGDLSTRVANAKRAIGRGMDRSTAITKYKVTSRDLDEPRGSSLFPQSVLRNQTEETDLVENPQKKLKQKQAFLKNKAKIKRGKEKAKRRMKNKKQVMKLTRQLVRREFFKKLTKGIPKSELTYAVRANYEKRLNSAGMKRKQEIATKKLFPKVYKAELAKKRKSKDPK